MFRLLLNGDGNNNKIYFLFVFNLHVRLLLHFSSLSRSPSSSSLPVGYSTLIAGDVAIEKVNERGENPPQTPKHKLESEIYMYVRRFYVIRF